MSDRYLIETLNRDCLAWEKNYRELQAENERLRSIVENDWGADWGELLKENGRLRHDIERHVKIASDLAEENERLRKERHELWDNYRTYLEAIGKLQAENERLRAADMWQPIDTKTVCAPCEERGIYSDTNGDGLYFFRATHWRPLKDASDE